MKTDPRRAVSPPLCAEIRFRWRRRTLGVAPLLLLVALAASSAPCAARAAGAPPPTFRHGYEALERGDEPAAERIFVALEKTGDPDGAYGLLLLDAAREAWQGVLNRLPPLVAHARQAGRRYPVRTWKARALIGRGRLDAAHQTLAEVPPASLDHVAAALYAALSLLQQDEAGHAAAIARLRYLRPGALLTRALARPDAPLPGRSLTGVRNDESWMIPTAGLGSDGPYFALAEELIATGLLPRAPRLHQIAARALTEALRREPSNLVAYVHLIHLLEARNDATRAEAILKVLVARPRLELRVYGLEALPALRAAVEARPGTAVLQFGLGALYLARGNPAAAVPVLEKASTADEEDPAAPYYLSQACLQTRAHQKAKAAIDQAIARGHRKARYLVQKGDIVLAEARRALQQAHRKLPEDATDPQKKTALAPQKKQLHEAREQAARLFEEALQKEPGMGFVLIDLGKLYLRLDEPKKAQACFEKMDGSRYLPDLQMGKVVNANVQRLVDAGKLDEAVALYRPHYEHYRTVIPVILAYYRLAWKADDQAVLQRIRRDVARLKKRYGAIWLRGPDFFLEGIQTILDGKKLPER